jgi:hypothetical protein
MRALRYLGLLAFLQIGISSVSQDTYPQKPSAGRPVIPKTWDDEAIATLEVSLAHPAGSPKHVSADYYYKIPVRPIYKQYPLYAPGHEPPGYMDWLKQQEPVVVWGEVKGKQVAPPLKTQADWIKAGEMVFESALTFVPPLPQQIATKFYETAGRPVPSSGVDPFAVCVIRQKGKVEVGFAACADCHTRVMPDGSVIKGAQGNNPIDRGIAFVMRGQLATAQDKQALLAFVSLGERSLFEVPWLPPSEPPDYSRTSVEEIAATHAAIPAGVFARQRSSVLYPPQIPDLIGVKDRHYLDRTGLQQHRGIVDLMRYAALNQGADNLASYDGFVPAAPDLKTLPDPGKLNPPLAQPDRYSDEQLYALGVYIYSLQPPPNPNKFDALAERGERIFERESCVMCHTPPLYTNNKLTPGEGFTIPEDHLKKYDILPMSVGTDPNLTLKTRRGTGYYKVPSLRGVWYRGMFGHSGWCATLEDWFDPRRVRDDYVPPGFKPYGATTYAVRGHRFGLSLSKEDREALIAFLRTL